jgi:hypothetical protein
MVGYRAKLTLLVWGKIRKDMEKERGEEFSGALEEEIKS